MSLCVDLYVYVYVGAHVKQVYMLVCACEGQRSTLRAITWEPFTLILDRVFHWALGLIDCAGLVG